MSDKTTTPNETNDAAPNQPPTEALAVVRIEGQEIPLNCAIAADDNLLKAALSPHYPSIQNASITRETVKGTMTVSIVKRAQQKGRI